MIKTLYKRDNRGKVVEWTIEVDGNKYRTTTGIVNGNLVTSEWTTTVGKNLGRKNATTDEEQSLFEAEAKIIKQREKGYTDDISNVDEASVFSPMLAKNYDDYKDKIIFPVFVQPKLDGIRCPINKTGMWTRKNKPIVSCPHIWDGVYDYIMQNNIGLDGELYNHTLKDNFNEICSLVKREKK